MGEFNPVFGILLVALGVVFWLTARLIMRGKQSIRPAEAPGTTPHLEGLLESHQDAFLLVQQGGRIVSLNKEARQLFRLNEVEVPNLEWLARRTRPAEPFLGLCAAEGKARFLVEGRTIEGTSYHLAMQPVPLVMVSLRTPSDVMEVDSGSFARSSHSLQSIIGLAQSMTASLDLEDVIKAILSNLEHLLPADTIEVTIWEEETRQLVPYRMLAGATGDNRLEKPEIRYQVGVGFSGWLAKHRKPLLVANLDDSPDLQPVVDLASLPLHAYMGVPLLASGEFIGTLEAGSFTPDTFTPEDQVLLELISSQAALSIRNALLFQREHQHMEEVSGLAQLAQSFSPSRDPQSLFSRLVQTITPLIKVEILGFLLYNESQRSLEGQVPFQGLPPQFVEIYRVPILPNSAAEHTLLEQDVIMTENASEDPQWEHLGLEHLAQAASLRDTVLVPLSSRGRLLGYLQASNHLDGSNTFTNSELRLLTVVANQAAPVIENATLIQQTRQRAQRAEGLRRIANLASSDASMDEILKFSIQELSHLLQAEKGVVFLIDRNRGVLEFHSPSNFGDAKPFNGKGAILPVDDPQYPFTASGSQHTLNLDRFEQQKPLIPFYQQYLAHWQLESAVVVPLIVHDECLGEIWLGSGRPHFFDQSDMQVVITAASQLSGVVEQAFLVNQTDESLRRRVEQMTILTRINRELSTSLDLKALLHMIYTEALRSTRADCGTIMLFDQQQSSSQPLLARFHVGDAPLARLSDIENEALEPRSVLNIPDVEKTSSKLAHEGILSALLIPIHYQQKLVGLIELHSKKPAHFDTAAVEITQLLSSQAAVALGNALQYEEQANRSAILKRQLDTLDELFRVYQVLRPDRPLDESLMVLAEAITKTSPFSVTLISVYDSQTAILQRVAAFGLSSDSWEELKSHSQTWEAVEQLFQPEYRVGRAYFIPADRMPVVPPDVHAITLLPTAQSDVVDAWQPDDMLVIPLRDPEGKPLGMISVDAPRDGRRPDRSTIEIVELFALQASLAIENHNMIIALDAKRFELEASLTRLQQADNDARQQIPALLHKDLAQTIEIQKLTNELNRLHTGLDIAEATGAETSISTAMRALAQALLTRFNFQFAFIGEQREKTAHPIDSLGELPAGFNLDSYFGQRNPLRQALQDGEMLLVSNLEETPEWMNTPLLNTLGARSFVCIPIKVSPERTIAVLAGSNLPQPAITAEDRQIFSQLAVQVTIGLQNLDLLDQTRSRLKEVDLLLEFTQGLGSLNPSGILNALVESVRKVIPEAEAGWAALWDEPTGQLVPQACSGYPDPGSLLEIRFKNLGESVSLPLRIFLNGQPKRVAEVRFAEDYNLSTGDLLHFRQATGGRLPISSLIVPLQRAENQQGVLVVDNFETTAAFSPEDESLVMTLSQQASLALENARLFVSVGQRAAQLQSLTQVAAVITSSLNREELVNSLLDQLESVLPYNTATLWLRDGKSIHIAAARGFEDDESRVGLSVALEDSALFQQLQETGQPVRVGDVRQDERFPRLENPEFLSWLGIPLLAKGELIGVIALEKIEAEFYTNEHLQVGTTFAGQAATGLENARLFDESQRRASELDARSARLALLNRFSAELGAILDIETILNLTAQQLVGAFDNDLVSAVLLGEKDSLTLITEVPGVVTSLPMDLPQSVLFERLRQTLGIFTTTDIASEQDLSTLSEFFKIRKTVSLMVVPLLAGTTLLGWLWLQQVAQRRYSPSEVELARTICNQAAIAIQNARLFAETRRLTEDLERRVAERTEELRGEHKNTQTLLRIISELSNSLDIDQVLTRTLAVLNDSIGSEQSAILLANSPQVVQAGLNLCVKAGEEETQPEAEIAQWVMQRRVPALVDDITSDERWNLPGNIHPAYKSVIAVPLILGEEVLGCLLLFHRQAGAFFLEQAGLVEATARQMAIALNNAELFKLIREQSENLGAMLREQQIEASRSRAILEAVADGVLVTDESNEIALFNASAERILDLKSDAVLGQPLEKFMGLFGDAASTWIETIHSWYQQPENFQPGQSFVEQISLDNGRVVAVSLAPVFWRDGLLGTVSIFRDVTHEVQVDRLKSEFVANVSHELRTPMTSIKGYVEILLMGAAGPISDQQHHFLDIVKNNTERLSVLVNDLLDISRIESGRITLSLQPLILREIAEDVAADTLRRSKEENKVITVDVKVPEDLPLVEGDLERVRQILSNLVSNGYNYTPGGGKVTIRARREEDEVQVSVQDTGIGIIPADKHRIFERFYRGEDPLVLATSGAGLGLAISRQLVDMHHGRIWFTSPGRNKGATFNFTLPIYRTEE